MSLRAETHDEVLFNQEPIALARCVFVERGV